MTLPPSGNWPVLVYGNGQVLSFAGPAGPKNLSGLIEAYFGVEGQRLRINIVDVETLRAAQREPDTYWGLVVRVTGYSAYFVTLDRQSQDLLIAAASR